MKVSQSSRMISISTHTGEADVEGGIEGGGWRVERERLYGVRVGGK